MVVDFKLVQPTGILDGPQMKQVGQEVNEALQSGVQIVLIDLEKVTLMDSAGLGGLVSTLKKVRAANGQLYLCSVNPQVTMVFELTKMDRVFQMYTNRQEFDQARLTVE